MKRRNLIILASLFCCLITAGLLAAPADSDIENQLLRRTSDSNSSTGGLGPDLVTILIALAVVIAAILLLLRLLRRWFPALAPAAGPGAAVKPLARFHLAPRQTLHLVRCGSRLLLLGATSASINHITTIEDSAEIDRILQAVNRGESPLTGLSRLFHRSVRPQTHERHNSATLPEKLEGQQ